MSDCVEKEIICGVSVQKKSDGDILFDMVAAHLELVEKDYFGLAFYDETHIHHWLYKDKKIAKQLKSKGDA